HADFMLAACPEPFSSLLAFSMGTNSCPSRCVYMADYPMIDNSLEAERGFPMIRLLVLSVGFWLGCMLASAGADDKAAAKETAEDVAKALTAARKKGLDWLTKNQAKDGSWGKTYTLAVTSFACLSYLGNSDEAYTGDDGKALIKGLEFLLSQQKEGQF